MRSSAAILATLALLTSTCSWCVGMIFCGGDFCYPLDDTYIHLAISRTLAESGTWGIEPGVPCFASSSPLWTILLAVSIRLFGIVEWVPLVLATVFAIGGVWVVDGIWKRAGMSTIPRLVFGLFLIFVVPISVLTNLGMEHALHFFLVESLLACSWRMFASHAHWRYGNIILGTVSFLAVATRYETMFLIIPLMVVFLTDRQLKSTLAASMGCLPIVLMGCYQLSCGRDFFPVSILLKTRTGTSGGLGIFASFFSNVSNDTLHAYALLLILLLICLNDGTVSSSLRRIAFVVAVAFGGHIVFAQLGWMYRYEAYLMGAACSVLPLLYVDTRMKGNFSREDLSCVVVRKFAGVTLAVMSLYPLAARSIKAAIDLPCAQREIYSQQRQMARIFASLPTEQRGPIVLNDLGCLALWSGAHVIDLVGLGSPEVARLYLERGPSTFQESLARVLRDQAPRYGAFYSNWYSPEVFSNDFKIVAHLFYARNPVVIGTPVVFGVFRESDKEPFKVYLQQMESGLPKDARLVFCE